MGSGRGQSRRALAAASGAGVKFDVDKWISFVHDQGIGKVGLVDYCNVNYHDVQLPPCAHDVSTVTSQTTELATEFFQDLVGVGAITLPAGVDADDFEFDVRIVEAHKNASYEVGMLIIKNKKTNHETRCCRSPWSMLNREVQLSDYSLQEVARFIVKSVRALHANEG